MSNYRFDKRSKEEFVDDIKASTRTESVLLNLWLDYLERKDGTRPVFRYTGCGEDDGEFLEDKKVTTHADYQVDGHGLVEIKFSKKLLPKVFHLKEKQVESYLKQEANILMVNGAMTDDPVFTIITHDALKGIAENCKVRPWPGFGNKRSYIVHVSDFIWRHLKDE